MSIILASSLVWLLCSANAPQQTPPTYAVRNLFHILDHGLFAHGPIWIAAKKAGEAVLSQSLGQSERTQAINSLVDASGGKHSQYISAQEMTESILTDKLPLARERLPRVEVNDRVATLTIPAFASEDATNTAAYVAAADSEIRSHVGDAPCGWIVDLRNNGGGKSEAMLRSVLPFFTEGPLLNEYWPRQSTRTIVSASSAGLVVDDTLVMPVSEELPDLSDKRVAVLQSRSTASAAEHVLLAFGTRDQTASFGEDSAGLTTLNNLFPMPDGSAILLSVGTLEDKYGNSTAGPIPPDRLTDPIPRKTVGNARSEAQAWLTDSCG